MTKRNYECSPAGTTLVTTHLAAPVTGTESSLAGIGAGPRAGLGSTHA